MFRKRIAYLASDWRVTMRSLSTRLQEYAKNPWYLNQYRLITDKEIMRHGYPALRKEKGTGLYRRIKHRISRLLKQEEYVSEKYGHYFLFKYDISSVDKEVLLYSQFVEIPSTILNAKRHNKDMDSFILDHAWNVDENSKGEFHMHLFLYCDASWITGQYSVDKELYER